ncbi:FecCD family ABC transporter permease [Sediminispirochaeta smaragdinae]|uniref:Transport system permease protein n=1 Tax=Sediminispirochaeta smaragdinae (strain DSM 11293 / JCM 15392 / SEBR 4228) TaxID=573413 RepID=E1R865_SEDSS|nr:iron ABC transporter permease [Sediminispirochaeta smaragdinae]ADK82920.1 transport system permease protein [Sediminispirochaeta smaragdinae DSM 11293]
MQTSTNRKKIVWALLVILPIVLFFFSLTLGRYPISFTTCIKILASTIFPIHKSWSVTDATVVLQIRLPRTFLAMCVGGALSISGAAFQGIFRNPLVSPDILGVSAAAGFGAALAILISGDPALVRLLAFSFGLTGVMITYFLSRVYKTTSVVMLVLSGVVVSAFFSALISVAKYVADPYSKLPAITFWLMGGLNTVSTRDIWWTLPPLVLGITLLLLVRWRINILSFGDEEASSLGINTELLKAIVIFSVTLMTAASVCISGIIGWVGLVIPHIGRMLVGPDHKVLLPVTLIIGAFYLLAMDDIARTVSSAEIPLGILTAIVGSPFFGYLIRKTRGGWS